MPSDNSWPAKGGVIVSGALSRSRDNLFGYGAASGSHLPKSVVGISVPARNAESAMGILNEMPYLQEVSIQGMYTRESQRQRAETEVAVAITRGRQAMPRVNVTGVLMRARD